MGHEDTAKNAAEGSAPDPMAIAQEVAASIASGSQIEPFSNRPHGLDLQTAYRVQGHLRALRGAPVVGRKIGFTNRTIWPLYGVEAPMWGDVTEASLANLSAVDSVPLGAFCEPRLEPEVALCLSEDPDPAMDETDLIAITLWMAPAFEIVHSIYPAWRFQLADTVACGGLHGRLLLGEPLRNVADFAGDLPALTLRLERNGEVVETGSGTNVLGGPLSALKHCVAEVAKDPSQTQLKAGDIVTTGTLTDAWSIKPGETWRAHYDGTPFASTTVRFAE
ncbi:MAG: fumarylacetoacetate hydrolase family protein [Pseudomonadota bacterium]